jgi:hypothetical protein
VYRLSIAFICTSCQSMGFDMYIYIFIYRFSIHFLMPNSITRDHIFHGLLFFSILLFHELPILFSSPFYSEKYIKQCIALQHCGCIKNK